MVYLLHLPLSALSLLVVEAIDDGASHLALDARAHAERRLLCVALVMLQQRPVVLCVEKIAVDAVRAPQCVVLPGEQR
jgi:hypothetical protein